MYCDNLFLYLWRTVIHLLARQLFMNSTNYICIACLVLCYNVCFYIMLKWSLAMYILLYVCTRLFKTPKKMIWWKGHFGRISDNLTCSWSEFQRVVAATEKNTSPSVSFNPPGNRQQVKTRWMKFSGHGC